MNLLILDLVVAAGNNTLYELTTKIDRNIKIFANNLTNDDHCISAAVHLPTLASSTIIERLECSCLDEGVDKNIGSLNEDLIALNFCGPTTYPEDYLHYSIMSRSVVTADREKDLNQDVHLSKPKTAELFIRGQAALPYFNILLETLIVNCMHCPKLQIKLNHKPPIVWFLMELSKVVK